MTSKRDGVSKKALETRARRAAYRVGLIAKKSRHHDDADGFLLEDSHGYIKAGGDFSLSAEDVIAYCATY